MEENKKKLDGDARLGALERKVYEEIPKYVILESLALSIMEVQRKATKEATMVDDEPVYEEVIVESIKAQSELEAKQAKRE